MGRTKRAFALTLCRRAGGADSNVPRREIALRRTLHLTNVHISDRLASLAFLLFVAVVLALSALLRTDRLLACNTLSLPVKKSSALKAVAFPSQILARDALGTSEEMSEALRAKCLIGDCRTAAA